MSTKLFIGDASSLLKQIKGAYMIHHVHLEYNLNTTKPYRAPQLNSQSETANCRAYHRNPYQESGS